MGCDIHSHAERRNENGDWEKLPGFEPFGRRSYSVFGFLADVRNYSGIPPIAEKRGVPEDISTAVRDSYDDSDAHSASWLAVSELAAFDYDAPCEDRRVTRQIGHNAWNGGCTCAPGEGQMTTFREFLGDSYFADLQKLKVAGAERVVFWFDN